ncbi:carbohydrate ABC transporter permease [Clostridium vincentii]|uniref:sn-glycerol-3-phosphate transport system permease protein UgpA n=1 Tax=Clostridium vincentii TaxID=52704 RepID=A0A2T0BIT3_9CLOT|nr:sugar ABC transporter permease [Clostridium vincentii]PRR83799.1 sn-glycerol-3-phosphate transport system permease protein UgpA [Clostridium vincentii]
MIEAKKIRPYVMITPALMIFVLFAIYPIGYMIYLSFNNWDLISPVKEFIGLNNFKDLLQDELFIQVIKNSIVYMVLTVSGTMLIGILLALFLNKDTRINRILQSVTFAPYIVSLVSVAFIWKWIMDTDYGLLNYFMNLIGLDSVNWLNDTNLALISVAIISIWKSLGYNALIILAGLKGVPKYIYEAAELDEAKPIKLFFKITLPMISPSLFFLAIMNIIASFKVFETIALVTGGGPMNSTNTLVFYIYEYGFRFNKIGYASAAGVILFAIIAILTVLYFKALGKKVHYR